MMKKILQVSLLLLALVSGAKGGEPDFRFRLPADSQATYVLVFREELDSEFYAKANGTIIPIAIHQLDAGMEATWGISSVTRQNADIGLHFFFKRGRAKESEVIHSFPSKGDDGKLIPAISVEGDGYRLKIREEDGTERSIVIVRSKDLQSFRQKFKVSPLMPGFSWDPFLERAAAEE